MQNIIRKGGTMRLQLLRRIIMLTLRIKHCAHETWRSPAENGVLWCMSYRSYVKNGDFGDKTGVILGHEGIVWWQKLAQVSPH